MQTLTTGTLALIILSAVLVQIAVVVLFGFYRRRRQYRSLDKPRSEAKIRFESHVPVPSAAQQATKDLSWEGFGEFMVSRREFEDSNRSICSFLSGASGR